MIYPVKSNAQEKSTPAPMRRHAGCLPWPGPGSAAHSQESKSFSFIHIFQILDSYLPSQYLCRT